MGMFSEDVIFWEKGRRLSYDFLVEYCPQLPKDPWQPEESSSERVMLGENVAYEILTERLIHPEDGSIHMRTTTQLLQQLGAAWKIPTLKVALHLVKGSTAHPPRVMFTTAPGRAPARGHGRQPRPSAVAEVWSGVAHAAVERRRGQ